MNELVSAPDRCHVCGRPIEQPVAQGRPRRHCSAACRQRSVRATRARTEAMLGVAIGGVELESRMLQTLAELPDEAFSLPARS